MQQSILDLVGKIYDTVSDSRLWQSANEDLSSLLGAKGATFRLKSYSLNRYDTISRVGYDDSFDEKYLRYYHKLDPWVKMIDQMPCGLAMIGSEVISEKAFKQSEIYNDFFSHYDLCHVLGALLVNNEQIHGRMGFHRSIAQGEFNEQEKQALQSLLPHMTRAFQLGMHFEKMKGDHSCLMSAFYTASRALVLIDEDEQVMFVSQRAESIINQYCTIDVVVNKLHVFMRNDANKLQQMIHQAVLTGKGEGLGSGGGLRIVDAHSRELNLVVTPYHSPVSTLMGSDKRICAIVFIHEPNQQVMLPSDVLRTLYKLSPAEIRLVQGLMNGLSINVISDEFGISVHTARSHLRSIFSKTNVDGQAGLMRLISGLMGVIE